MSERTRIQRKRDSFEQAKAPQTSLRHAIQSPTGGQSVDSSTRAALEPRFGHSFADVRVHADADADQMAQQLEAHAFTVGQDVYFRQGAYEPASLEGLHLLAHELTHVVQHERHGAAEAIQRGQRVSDPADASEREASTVADQVVAGNGVQVVAAPSALASRGLLDWVEEKASDVGDVASSAWDGTKSVASSAWDGTKSVASDIYSGMKMNAGFIKQGEEAINHGIDWVEDKEKAGTRWLANKAEGIPVLEQVANAGAKAVDLQTEFTGGALRGVTGLVGGVATMAADPVDTVIGLEAMAEHVPGLPGVPNPLKAAHGLLNVATGDETLGQFANKTFNPIESMKDDGQFWMNVGGGLVGQYSEQWKQGKYADVAGHAGFDIASLFVGAGEANAAGKLGEASKLIEAAKLGEGVSAANDVARVVEPMGEAHNAARYQQYKAALRAGEQGNGVIESLMTTGDLPGEYMTKAEAQAAGWKPGKPVGTTTPGGQIGGDVFENRPAIPGESPLLPEAEGRVWNEADVGINPGASRSKQPGTRLLYSSDGEIYVTADHYESAHPLVRWK